MKKLLGHPESLKKVQTKYCAGCGHGIVHRLITSVIDELGLHRIKIKI